MSTQAPVANSILAQKLEMLQRQISSRQAAVASLSYAGASTLDRATLVQEWDRMLALQAFEERNLAQLNHAMELHDNGHGGLCEDCGQPIDPERLKVMPEATRCRPCKEKRERIVVGWHC